MWPLKTRNALVICACALLVGCQTQPPAQSAAPPNWTDAWQTWTLPGKRASTYTAQRDGDRWVLHAQADASAGMFRRKLHVEPAQLGRVTFSWKVPALPDGADVRERDAEDAAARVLLAFDGEVSRLSPRTQLMFDLMRSLTGEAPPYATLMYVWDTQAPAGSLVVNNRSDRVRKIVLESGTANLGQWRSYTRDIAADFRRAFGEEPGALIGIAVMTDSDNTQSRTEAWYAEVRLD